MQSKQFALITSFVILLALLIFSFFHNLSLVPIRLWDEGRVVTNALNMRLNGNWIVTYFDGKPDLWNTKPPFLIWMQVISMNIFGVSEWSVRFPSAMASVLTGLTLWAFCTRYLRSTWAGFLAGCVFASTFAFVFDHAGRTGDYDALLVLFNTLYCLSFYLFCKTDNNKWLLSFFIFLTLAALTKGVAGMFLAPSILLYTITQKKLLRLIKDKWFYLGVVSFLFIAVGYYFLRDHYNPGYIKAVFGGELGSFPQTLNQHDHPFLWYIENMIEWRYPFWWMFVLPAFIFGFINRSENVKKITLFNIVMVVPYLLIVSSANTKLLWYELPIYPFLSLQIGLGLYSFWLLVQERLPISALLPKLVLASLLFLLIFVIPFRWVHRYTKHFSTQWPWDAYSQERSQGLLIQQAIKNKQDLNNYVFCYDDCADCHGQIDFYILLLQEKNVNVHFQTNLDSLKPGSHVVVSQAAMKQKLEKNKDVQFEKEAYGCSVYTVK